jgi:hypothetical protein
MSIQKESISNLLRVLLHYIKGGKLWYFVLDNVLKTHSIVIAPGGWATLEDNGEASAL